jgi:hypothetical protein
VNRVNLLKERIAGVVYEAPPPSYSMTDVSLVGGLILGGWMLGQPDMLGPLYLLGLPTCAYCGYKLV